MTAPLERSRGGLAPEARVILATVRGDPAELREALRETGALGESHGFDWSTLLRVAEWEMATPVLHGQLRVLRRAGLTVTPPPLEVRGPATDSGFATGSGDWPSDPVQTLERLALVHEFRLREFQARFGRLLEAVVEEGVEVLLLKGAALAERYYPSMIDRPMSDVDLLVRESDTDRLRAMATDLGWRSGRRDIPDSAYETHHHLRPMSDDAGLGMGLEIHTELFPEANPFALSAEELWRESESARPVDHGGSQLPGVRIPAPHHLLLHNALHFTWSHGFRGGAWKALRDVNVLVESGRIDWDRFVEDAERSRGITGAYWLLDLAREWTGAPVPIKVLQTLDPGFSAPVRRILIRHFGAGVAPDPRLEPPTAVGHGLWELAMQPARSGHGSLRPWSEADKWLADEEDEASLDSEDSDPGEPWSVWPGSDSWVGKGVRAFRYIAGLVRPIEPGFRAGVGRSPAERLPVGGPGQSGGVAPPSH